MITLEIIWIHSSQAPFGWLAVSWKIMLRFWVLLGNNQFWGTTLSIDKIMWLWMGVQGTMFRIYINSLVPADMYTYTLVWHTCQSPDLYAYMYYIHGTWKLPFYSVQYGGWSNPHRLEGTPSWAGAEALSSYSYIGYIWLRLVVWNSSQIVNLWDSPCLSWAKLGGGWRLHGYWLSMP